MLNRKWTRKINVVGIMLILITSLFAVRVLAYNTTNSEHPTIVANVDGITLPEGLMSGITTLTFQNELESTFQPTLARFINDATLEDFMAAMMAQDFVGMLATVSALGSPLVEVGETVDVTYDLLAGEYILLSFQPAAPPIILPFMVAENTGEPIEAPEENLEVVMDDFVFAMPTSLTSEDILWKFSNDGEQVHEIVIFKVDEDATTESVTQAILDAMAAASPNTPIEYPYEQVFSFVGLSPDETAWMNVELEPGNYVALCVIPDTTSEELTLHLLHGMITLFSVSK